MKSKQAADKRRGVKDRFICELPGFHANSRLWWKFGRTREIYHFFPIGKELRGAWSRSFADQGRLRMTALHQITGAGMTVLFSAILLATSHQFLEARSAKSALMASKLPVLVACQPQVCTRWKTLVEP